jgi:predicted transcriptional regulator
MPTPTARELEILKVLWEHGPSSVKAVHRQLARGEDQDLAYNTVQTLLRIMEDKGLVAHQAEGRTFIYHARYSRDQTQDESAARFLDQVFDGAASQLVMSLLRAERVPPEELERLNGLIAEARRRKSGR